MFRKGGSANEGITSGLQSRPGFSTGRSTKERLLEAIGTRPARLNFNDFLINFGLNMVGNPPSGGIFQTAAKEAQLPFQQFQQSRAKESLGRRELIANLVQNLSEDEKYKLWAEAESIFEAGGVNPFTNQPFKSAQEAFDTLLKNKFMSKERVLTEEAKFENTYNTYFIAFYCRNKVIYINNKFIIF